MAAKKKLPQRPIDRRVGELVAETCTSFFAATGQEMPVALAHIYVLKSWLETWPLYLSSELAKACDLGQIAEANGATIGGEAAAATEEGEDDAEE